jgi:hypothetical protein
LQSSFHCEGALQFSIGSICLLQNAEKERLLFMRLTELRPDSEPTELEKQKTLFGIQIINLIITGVSFLVWWFIVERFWPDFFNPGQFWCITENLWGSIFKFYPLFIYCGVLSIICCFGIKNSYDAEPLLLANIVTSTLAGIWEELGFRCIFIMSAMITIMFSNWCWSVLMIIFVIIGIVSFIAGFKDEKGQFIILGAIFAIVCGGLLIFVYAYGIKDPVYWVYEHITFPILSFISFGQLDFVLFNKGLGFLFIAGAVSTNAKFRDGHKYQGPIGVLNAWFVGFVFLYAMLTYGLIVAIIVHALYDIEVGFIRYGYRKVIAVNGD